jgi:hypothetical protein
VNDNARCKEYGAVHIRHGVKDCKPFAMQPAGERPMASSVAPISARSANGICFDQIYWHPRSGQIDGTD